MGDIQKERIVFMRLNVILCLCGIGFGNLMLVGRTFNDFLSLHQWHTEVF